MGGEPDISVPARALGDPARALMASALLGNRQIPASELARVAGVSASTASEHLRVLMNAELINVEQRGRNRFYRLASESAARAVEALQGIAPLREVRSLRQSSISADLRHARTCYDHLAGDLGMRVTDLLTRSGVLSSLAVGESVDAPSPFPQGVIVDTLQLRPPQGARAWGRGCLDWSTRRPHVAGQLGAQVLATFEAEGWLLRRVTSRAVRLTARGEDMLIALESRLESTAG